MQAPHLRPYFYMLSGCFWFALMGILTHAMKGIVDWQIVAIARSSLAFLFALIVAWSVGTHFVWLRPRVLWIRSISGSCSMVTTFYALMHIPVSDVLTITNTFPLWIAILSWPMGERPTLSVWAALISAIVGVACTQKFQLTGVELAHAAALAASVFTAVAMLGINRLKGLGALAVVVHFSAVSTVFCVASYFIFDHTTGATALTDWGVLLRMLGVGGTATIGQVFLTKAFREGSATKVAVVSLSQVVMVMLYEGIFENRVFDLWQIIGTMLVLGPSGYLMARERKTPILETESESC